MCEEDIGPDARVCSRHYSRPAFCLTYQKGVRSRESKAERRTETSESSRRKCVTPVPSTALSRPSTSSQASVAPIGEQLDTNFQVHELPSVVDAPSQSSEAEVLVNTALLARIEALEAENTQLKSQSKTERPFQIDDIKHDDRLVRFYTGFVSYVVFVLVSFSLGQWWITLPTGDQKMAFGQDIGQGGLMHKISYSLLWLNSN